MNAPARRNTGQRTKKRKPIHLPRILVTTDFSRASLSAIPFALAVARQFGAEVHLLHVVDTTQYASKSVRLPLVSPAELSRPLLNRLQGVALKYAADGKIHVMRPREGRAYKQICEAARQLSAGLIVIATHGFTGLKHVLLGSTAERVVQHSPCPVLVVRQQVGRPQKGKMQPRRVVVPIDFSSCSQVAFDCAVGLACEFGAELLLVHVIDSYSYPFGDEYSALHTADLVEEARASAQIQMREMAVRASGRSSVWVAVGSPALRICDAANKESDLLVIPTHGRTGLGHVLIGSVAERVVRHAACPVLVIPARAKFKRGHDARGKLKINNR